MFSLALGLAIDDGRAALGADALAQAHRHRHAVGHHDIDRIGFEHDLCLGLGPGVGDGAVEVGPVLHNARCGDVDRPAALAVEKDDEALAQIVRGDDLGRAFLGRLEHGTQAASSVSAAGAPAMAPAATTSPMMMSTGPLISGRPAMAASSSRRPA